jgi:hypothetical protein
MKVGLFAIAFLALSAGVVRAGYRSYDNVVIYPGGTGAYGSLADARASSNANEMIGCRNYANPGGSLYCYCFARDKTGAGASCVTYDQGICGRAAEMNGDTYMYFTVDSAGSCAYLLTQNSSYETPKTP